MHSSESGLAFLRHVFRLQMSSTEWLNSMKTARKGRNFGTSRHEKEHHLNQSLNLGGSHVNSFGCKFDHILFHTSHFFPTSKVNLEMSPT